MANLKVLNKDPFTYAEERRRFLEDLRRFHTTRGTLFDRIPQIGGREVDLYRLYRSVTELGGWQKVNSDLLWEDIQEDFRVPLFCSNGVQALKYIYFRYLNIYEKVHFLGLDPDNCSDEQEEGPARKKICLPVELIPLSYNYNQHKVPDAQRENGQLSADLIRLGDYDKLELSLRSGLANEVDYAVNVCLLLSNEGRYALRLNKSLHLVTLLLANVGIFEEGPGTMEDVMTDSWRNSESKRDFLRFWHSVVQDEKMKEYIKTKNGIYKREEMVGTEVLHLGRGLGVRDAEGQRVLQVAMLIRNMSFEEINQPLLASDCLVFRFLMLCVHSSYGSLRQLALDTLGNLAAQMVLQPAEAVTTQLMLNLIKKSLVDDDKFVIVRGLEMLSKLCQLERNENIVSESLEEETYMRLVQLLTVYDIQLIVHTLEALYQLSEIGETTTTCIAGIKQAVDLLVNLITVEAQSYGPNSLLGIKVVEYVPPPDSSVSHHPSSIPPPSHTVIQCMPPGHGPGFPVQSSPHVSTSDQARSDLETTASNWLLGTYETKKGSVTKQSDLFAEYQQFCCKFGIADTLTATDIVSIAKSAVPQAKVAELDRGEGNKETLLKGLSRRAKPKPFAILAGSDKVDKSPACSVPVNSLRGPVPGPGNWPFHSNHIGHTPPNHTPTLRQRLMEPPQTPPLPHPFVNYAGSTGAGSPPSARPRGQQGATPKSGVGGGKKRAMASPAQPSGPGPGPGGTNPHPADSGVVMSERPMLILHQQVQVAGAPQPASSVLGGASVGEQVFIQSSSSPLLKPGIMPPPSFPHPVSAFSMTSLSISPAPPSAAASAMSPGQQFPTIHQALQGEAHVGVVGKLPFLGVADDTVFIKSLLAKKVCQNMVRQGNITPPPLESQPDCAGREQQSVPHPQPHQSHVDQQLPRPQHAVQQIRLQHSADQPAVAGPAHPHPRFPHMSPSVQQHQVVQTSVAQQYQLQQFAQQGVGPLVHQHVQIPAEQYVTQQQVVPQPQTVQSAIVQQSFPSAAEHFVQTLPCVVQPVLTHQQSVSSQMAPRHTQGTHLQLHVQSGQQQQGPLLPQAQHRTHAPLLLAQQHTTVPAQPLQTAGVSQLAQQQQTSVPSQLQQQTVVSSQFAQQQQLTGPTPLVQHQQNGQSQKAAPHMLQQTKGVLSQLQSLQMSPVMSATEQHIQQNQSQLIQTEPIPSQSQLAAAPPSQPQVNQSQLLQSHQAQSQQALLHVHQGQPTQSQSLSQGVQTQEEPGLSQGFQKQPQTKLLHTLPGQPQRLVLQAQQGQPVQNQSTPPKHGKPQMVSTQAQAGHSQVVHPLAQPMVHLTQGHQVMLHQEGHRQIHIHQRVPGPQQISMQGSSQQSLQLRSGQQPIMVQGQQNHVIQGQPTVQHILHQPLQIQSNQQVQGQHQNQGQNQPLRIQTQSSQPVVIQLPMYQLPQITSSQMDGCAAAAAIPTTLAQTVPYHPALPHQSPSVVAALSSQKATLHENVSSVSPMLVSAKPSQDDAEAKTTRDCVVSGDGTDVCASSQTVAVQSGGGYPNVCIPLSEACNREGRTVTSGLAPTNSLAPSTNWSAAASLSSSSALILHPAAAASSSSSSSSSLSSLSSSLHPSVTCIPSSSMSITQTLLSGQEVHSTGSTNTPLSFVRPSTESHPHLTRDNGYSNGSSVGARKDCNGLGGVVNGGLGSPDSASFDLPPSPMGRGKGGQDPHLPNGLLEGNNCASGWKEGTVLSKELLHSMAEKMSKINGVNPHRRLENGDAKISIGHNTDTFDQQARDSEEMDVDSPHKKTEVWQHVNGLSSLGSGTSSKESQVLGSPRPGQALFTQTSMEEVSLDSSDSRLVVNCGSSRAGGLDAGVGVRPLFSPNNSHDSDVSCDSFASSLADSVSSDKHSFGAHIFPRPSSAPSPSPSSSSCSGTFQEVPLVLAGIVPKTEAAGSKRGSKKKAQTPKPKAEKAASKSKKRKGGKNAAPESPTPPVPAVPLVMEYICEWAGCGRCFDNARLVYLHASKTHVPAMPEVVCQWQGCEPLRRKRWSLVTHLQDHHCSEMAQRAACQRRFQAAQTAAAASAQAPTQLQQAPALVYPPDAAMQAIKRFHIKPPFAEFADMREGPVTKHIRLTAALILRNLARFSALGRSLIKHQEQQLSYVSMSMCESSTALSNCLWEILHDT